MADTLRKGNLWLGLLVAIVLLAWWWTRTPAQPAREGPSRASPSSTEVEARTDLPEAEGVPFRRTPLREPNDAPKEAIGGRVVDASTGQPIAAVTVTWIADDVKAITRTSFDGVYHLMRPRNLEALRFAAHGYRAQERRGEDTPRSGRLPEVRLSPEETARVRVRWSGGEPVVGAHVGVCPRGRELASTASDGRERGVEGLRTDRHGVVEVPLGDPRPVYAIAPSGQSGTGLAVPGAECRIELVRSGARLELECLDPAGDPHGPTVRLKRLDGRVGSGTIPATGEPLPSPPILSVGRWSLELGEGPFVVAEILRDGRRTGSSLPAAGVVLEVLPETEAIRVALEAGWRIRLARADTGESVTGWFSYGKRLLQRDGSWIDGLRSRAVAGASGMARLAPLFADSDLGEGTSLRIDVPGFASAVIGAAELRAARADGDPLALRLAPRAATELVITHADGTPLLTSVLVRAVTANERRTVFAGRPDPLGSLGNLGIDAGESIEVLSVRLEPVASLSASALRLGERNRLIVPGGYGRIRITAVPPDAPSITVVGDAFDECPLTTEKTELVSGPLLPGPYFVGPPALARAASSRASGLGPPTREPQSAVIRMRVDAGVESSVPWLACWGPGRQLEGHVRRTDGTAEGLVVVPIFSRAPEAIGLGPDTPRLFLDADGRYLVAADQIPPVLLVACSLDAYGTPIPLDVLEPGEDATVLTCGLRLHWRGPVTEDGGSVTYAIDTAGFRQPLMLTRRDYRAFWHPSSPLLLEGLPCGTVELTVQVGDRWIERTASLARNPGGITELEVTP